MIRIILRTMKKIISPSLKIVAGSLLLLASTVGMAASCLDVFPTVLSSSANNGKVEFKREVDVNGTNGSLDIEIKKDETTDSNPSCISQKCTDSNNRSEAFSLPSFQTSSSSQAHTVDNGDSLNLPQGSYDKITVNFEATVRFTQNGNITFIKELNADNTDTTVIFEEGVYWIEKFKVGYRTKVIINGNDKVTLIIKNTEDDNAFNKTEVSFNVAGAPNQLVLIAYDDIKLGFNSDFKGFIYADKKVELKNDNVFEGAINGDDIKLKYQAAITYAPGSIESANFNGFCTVSDTPLTARINYRFDECTLNGETDDVIDQTGNYNGGSNGITPNTDSAIVNKSLDLSTNNTSDWIDVPSSAVDGLDDFSVAVWFKTSVNKYQQEIFHALGNDSGDDELEIFLNNSHAVYIKVRDSSEVLASTIKLTDGNWHHLVLTRVDKDVCLFIDGTEQECDDGVKDGVLSVTNANAIVMGQEQDSFGGSFTTEQSFVGQLDEFKIFDVKLSDTEIDNIYQNESDGNNFDGTTRDAMQCEYICGLIPGELKAVGIRIDSGGSDNQIDTISESLNIHAAWLNAGSPASGFIANGTYSVTESGASTVDRIDFGGDENAFAGTLPYPGIGNIGDESFSNFLVHTSGTLSLPAGDYTIYVNSDDGFSFVMDTLDGDTVTFNKFGNSTAGASNELRYENPTANSRTGGSFTLTQDSIFEISAIFFERTGSDFLEVSIANDLLDPNSTTDYEILREGAINDKVKLGLCVIQAPLLEYRFEGTGWDGSPDEIIDHTGNGHNGQVISNSIPEIASPALTSDYGTCGYASQNDGSIQVKGLPLDTSKIGVKTTVTFWMNWDGAENSMPIGWNLHDIWIVGGAIGFNTANSDVYGISSAGLAKGWHHVAVEFTNGSVANNRMHIDGVEQALSQRHGTPNNSLAFVDSELRIGGWSRDTNYDFHGLIDEVRVYQGVLTTTQVVTIMNERHDCEAAVPDHFEIQHDGQGFTCEAETLTISACADENCDTLYDQETSITLAPSGWFGGDTLVFTGELTTSLNVTEEDTVTLTKISASPDANLRCFNGSTETCEMDFVNDGFEFHGVSINDPLPDQVAEQNFSNVNLRAVRSNNGVCETLLEGAKDITLSYDCDAPDSCLSKFAGIEISGDGSAESSGTVRLNFDGDGIASLSGINYADAGRLKLKAQAEINGVTITSSINGHPIEIYPDQLRVSALPSNVSDTSLTYVAGVPFDLTIGAYGREGNLLPNYQPGKLHLSLQRVAPDVTTAMEGIFTLGSASLTTSLTPTFKSMTSPTFTGGKYSFTANYAEVGDIKINVRDFDYLDNLISSSDALDLGRFIPAYFNITQISTPSLTNTRTGSSYIGEYVPFSESLVYQITAKNALLQTTNNYGGTLWKLNFNNTHISFIDNSDNNGEILGSFNSNGTEADYDGIAIYTITQPNAAQFMGYITPLSLIPKTSVPLEPINMSFTPVITTVSDAAPLTEVRTIADSDDVCYQTNYPATCEVFDSEIIQGATARYGRLILESTYGPENENLSVPVRAQYFLNSQWLTNTADSLTDITFDLALGQLSLDSEDETLKSEVGNIRSTGTLTDGKSVSSQFKFTAPDIIGELTLTLVPDAADVVWPVYLNYDWRGGVDGEADGVIDTNDFPEATINFGLFRGSDRIIHWREVSN
jgi:MSHA biogenesis protein MshQ